MSRSHDDPNRTDPASDLAVRPPGPALRYTLVARALDAAAGRRDARADLRQGSSTDAQQPRPALAWQRWLSRARHMFRERDHREFLSAQVAAERGVAALQRLLADLERAEAAAQSSRDRLAAMPADVPASVVASRGPTELYEDSAAVEARRRQAHQRARQQASTAADADAQQVRSLTSALHQRCAELENLFAVTRIRSDRLREYSSRRTATYLHAYLKAVHRRGASHLSVVPAAADAAIEAPVWTTLPCPWTAPLRDRS